MLMGLIINFLVYFQIDLVCMEGSEGEGVKISPHIGYNCHDKIMEEMAVIVKACNNNNGGGRIIL